MDENAASDLFDRLRWAGDDVGVMSYPLDDVWRGNMEFQRAFQALQAGIGEDKLLLR